MEKSRSIFEIFNFLCLNYSINIKGCDVKMPSTSKAVTSRWVVANEEEYISEHRKWFGH